MPHPERDETMEDYGARIEAEHARYENALQEITKHDGSYMSLCGDQACHAVVLAIAKDALKGKGNDA